MRLMLLVPEYLLAVLTLVPGRLIVVVLMFVPA
jgi:hypothetical protein